MTPRDPNIRMAGLLAAAMAASTTAALADGSTITGSVVYLERMLLPDGSELRVTLEDAATDADAAVLAEVTVPARTSPTPFALDYPATDLAGEGSYALQATISQDGRPLFASADPVAFDPARTDGYELLVRRVAEADAAAPGIAGSWRLVDVGGTGALDDVQSTLTIGADGSVTGNGGCNGFGGSATIEGERISFGPLAGTLMACADPINRQEQAFHAALSGTAAFRIDAGTGELHLLDAGGSELARLAAE